MAKVATREPMLPSSKPLQFPGSSSNGGSSETTAAIMRKTPSQLRGEQLKQNRTMDIVDESDHGYRSKNPRYINTRVDDLFPSRKNSTRSKILSEKRNTTENVTADDNRTNNSSATKHTFRSVTELSLGAEKLSGVSIDMDKAFKGLAASVPLFKGNTNLTSAKFCSDFCVPEPKTPLDFTLKTSMRVVSSNPLNWFHRLMSGQFNPSTKTVYSWVYPQCPLPTSFITALTSSVKEEGQNDFLSNRQLTWETSFRSLYIMLRKNISNIFYVCTGQFVAMFTSGNASGACNAYLSQSTRTLRSLLKEQDICFTMPLCCSKVEQDSAEDLYELSEIERHNLGKSKRTVHADVDNTPESLLAFSGNYDAHGLYDFLLNYRFVLTSLTSYDVPLLYSPIPFENAALSAPQVKCKEVKRIDNLPVSLNESCTTSNPNQSSDSTSCYSIEIKDAYLPPWIVKSICDELASNGNDFEASFVTEPMSVGLNIVLDTVCQRSDENATSDEGTSKEDSPFGITNIVISPQLSNAFVKCLKYSNSSYTVSLSPV